MISILDYGAGNVRSIANMLNFLGCNCKITDDIEDIKKARALIFPGQGHFKQALNNLKNKKLIVPIKDFINSGKPRWKRL